MNERPYETMSMTSSNCSPLSVTERKDVELDGFDKLCLMRSHPVDNLLETEFSKDEFSTLKRFQRPPSKKPDHQQVAPPTERLSSSDASNENEVRQQELVALSCLSELVAVFGEVFDIAFTPAKQAPVTLLRQELPTSTTLNETNDASYQQQQHQERLEENLPKLHRRSIFDQSVYQPVHASTFLDDSLNSHCADHRTGLTERNRVRSFPGFYPRPEPGKSLLKGRDSSTGSLKRTGSNVSFSNLEIREYTIALSDHPDCSYGPPIQLGWEYCVQAPVSVDDYEETRCPRSRGQQLLLPYPVRRDWLLEEGGYTKQDLQWAFQEVERVKYERRVSETRRRDHRLSERNGDCWLGRFRDWFLVRMPHGYL